MTLSEIETALDAGKLQVRALTPYGGFEWLDVHRRGRTQTWKTKPGAFRIPVVHGIYNYGAVNEIGARDPSSVRIKP